MGDEAEQNGSQDEHGDYHDSEGEEDVFLTTLEVSPPPRWQLVTVAGVHFAVQTSG